MKQQQNRITAPPFAGTEIDRTRPLRFRLDGRTIQGFVGDTLLSAALATGIVAVGHHGQGSIALSTRHAPAIALANAPAIALPMDRVLASNGAEYITLAAARRGNALTRLFHHRQSLGLDLDRANALPRPWLSAPGQPGPQADLVVIGGGLAGMSAAITGAKRGLRVVLVEASTVLGGHARLFGTQDGEESPDQSIQRLTDAVAKNDAITVLKGCEAFALRPGRVRLHHVDLDDRTPTGTVFDIATPHIIVATGAIERLPVFAGNRLPQVTGACEAFHLAHHYGVWPGQSAVFATSSSPIYRLARLAHDAGIGIERIFDSRSQPQSRFVEFAKAYGMRLAAGTLVSDVTPAQRKGGITINSQLAIDVPHDDPPIIADRLIVSGGWQPDLTLWHMAGGESDWNAERHRLEPTLAPPGIVLAGSAAGWLSNHAVLESGKDAVAALLGRKKHAIEDRLIDPLYETPDGTLPIGTGQDEASPEAYLDAGLRYLARPRPAPERQRSWLSLAPKPTGWSLAESAEPLDIAGVAAGVALGAIPAASAGIVAQERVAMIGVDMAMPEPAPAAPQMPPPWLTDRYPGASLYVVAPTDSRRLETGGLILPHAEEADPLKAIGVVLKLLDNNAALALLIESGMRQTSCVRLPDRFVGIRVVAPWHDGMDLGAALRSGARAP